MVNRFFTADGQINLSEFKDSEENRKELTGTGMSESA